MKKLIPVVAIVLVLLVALCACNPKEPTKINEPTTPATDSSVINVSDTTIVLAPTSDYVGQTLLSFMQASTLKGLLEFSLTNGMVTSINGKENTADYSKCWMLYTSDANMANTAWGTVEYQGNVYGSAVKGVTELNIIENGLYIWVYTTF